MRTFNDIFYKQFYIATKYQTAFYPFVALFVFCKKKNIFVPRFFKGVIWCDLLVFLFFCVLCICLCMYTIYRVTKPKDSHKMIDSV